MWVRSFRYLKRLKQLQRRRSVLPGSVYFNISETFFFFSRKEICSQEEIKHSERFYPEWFFIVFKETTQYFKYTEAGKCPNFCLSVLAALCHQFNSYWLHQLKFSINRPLFFGNEKGEAFGNSIFIYLL